MNITHEYLPTAQFSFCDATKVPFICDFIVQVAVMTTVYVYYVQMYILNFIATILCDIHSRTFSSYLVQAPGHQQDT